ncbi:MAG: methyltransferase domain-containing protein [Gammaproteobacteria bacterium]|nr:methyltransferase domain-containing protein [Gammaproteobacteria bacterium]
MNNTTKNIALSFNRHAHEYDEHNHLQNITGTKLIKLISHQSNQIKNLIDLGCGTGVVTKQLAESLNYKNLYAIDIAEKALAITKINLREMGAHIYQENFDNLNTFNQTFDLVFANMSLQWSQDLFSTLSHITTKMNSQGIMAISLPLPGTFNELQNVYACNPLTEVIIIQDYFRKLNFEIILTEKDIMQFQFNHTRDALQSIKNIGANYVIQRPHKGLTGKTKLKQLQLTTLTYYVGYFIARKC